MCGIHGDFAYAASATAPDPAVACRVRDAMSARGPDGYGVHISSCRRLILTHRRLSILDPSTASAQPMASSNGRFVIVFNGEIYNFREVRDDLERAGVRVHTTGDTEVLLHAYMTWGPKCLERLIGMFAFAIWDERDRSLFLARDHHGIKPLYYASSGGRFRFASSVRALLEDPATSREVDRASIVAFLAWGSVPGPRTIFSQIRSLPAGHHLVVTERGALPATRYWHVADALRAPAAKQDAIALDSLVREECRATAQRHIVADVPVGLFLSAGVDSTALLGLTHEVAGQPPRTITLAFEEFAGTPFDESVIAERSAKQNCAQHETVRLTYDTVESGLATFLSAMDQPTNDGLNTYWVSYAAHHAKLKAVMSGVGADELFGGYPSFARYPALRRLAPALSVLPVRSLIDRCVRFLPNSPRRAKLEYITEALADPAATYHLVRGVFVPSEIRGMVTPDVWRAGHDGDAILGTVRDAWSSRPSTLWGEVWAAEHGVYLRSQLLRDSDWASMAHSLELRTPFVDRRLTERLAPVLAAWNGRARKLPLANATRPRLDRAVSMRKKTGFVVPMRDWMLRALDKGILRAPPRAAFRSDVAAEATQGLRANKLHWSRAWGLFVLGSYLADTRAAL